MGVTRASLISTVIFTVVLQSGCSYLFVNGPPDNHPQLAVFDCTESNAWPVVDAIWAGLNGLGAATALGNETTANRDQVIAVGTTWLVISGTSAIYGFSKVRRCSTAMQQRNERFFRTNSSPPGPEMPAPAPAPASAPGAVPAPEPNTAPAPTAPPVSAAAPAPATAQAPETSLAPSRPRLPVPFTVRSSPSRSLAMRTALAE